MSMILPNKPKIFLSSTFIDLAEARREVSNWLSGIFGAELIIMETSGSDAAPPEVNSVRRVRECDVFVGIYAYRYGTIDPTSGKSITELELDEAKVTHSSGGLRNILLYIIDKDSTWLLEHQETTQSGLSGMRRLRGKVQQHTWTSFKTPEELLFNIVRDIYKELAQQLGTFPLTIRQRSIPLKRVLNKPTGMEFLTSADRGRLIGRDVEVEKLLNRLDQDSMVLLLGESGVGKTSLIHAGLIPKAADNEWWPIYTRPFGLPFTDILRQIQTTVYQGRPGYQGMLVPLLAEVITALGNATVLLITDQFEDVLTTRDQTEIMKLVDELGAMHRLRIPELRVLISYRSDLEGRLGEYWQQVSGSPRGLPRVYLSGVKEHQAWQGIRTAAQDLAIKFDLTPPQRKRIQRDLSIESQAAGFAGVYPPYIQMMIDHVWRSSLENERIYDFKHFQESGGAMGIIGNYLSKQLDYASDPQGHTRLVLVSLVRSYGVKAQRTIEEIIADSGLDQSSCEVALEKLIDLRLVRHIENYYEISHDFIARRILAELVDSEEREFKRFTELLRSKAAAFQTTGALLTPEELLMLYKHKERVVLTDPDLLLILSSWLQGRGPALFWLLSSEVSKILAWLRHEESREDITREGKVSNILLRRKIGEAPLIEEDYSAFRRYQLAAEMAFLVLDNPLCVPMELLKVGLRHRREEVREASMKAVSLQVRNGSWDWIPELRKSTSSSFREAYFELIIATDVPVPTGTDNSGRAIQEFTLLKMISIAKDPGLAKSHFAALECLRPLAASRLFGEALVCLREGKVTKLLDLVAKASPEKNWIPLATVRQQLAPAEYDVLLSKYENWNSHERGSSDSTSVKKARLLAEALFRASSQKSLPRLRETVGRIRLTNSSREIVRAILEFGYIDDLRLVLTRIAGVDHRINYWNHTALGLAVLRRMKQLNSGVPAFLLDIANSTEFWTYIDKEERPTLNKKDLLPVKDIDNRALYVRIAAYAMIGLCTEQDQELLIRLSVHSYGLIARTAAMRLVQIHGERALKALSERIDESIKSGTTEHLAESIRYAEMELYGLTGLL